MSLAPVTSLTANWFSFTEKILKSCAFSRLVEEKLLKNFIKNKFIAKLFGASSGLQSPAGSPYAGKFVHSRAG